MIDGSSGQRNRKQISVVDVCCFKCCPPFETQSVVTLYQDGLSLGFRANSPQYQARVQEAAEEETPGSGVPAGGQRLSSGAAKPPQLGSAR